MEGVTEYLRDAQRLTVQQFEGLHTCRFLVKHPRHGLVAPAKMDFDYATRTVNVNEDPLAGECQLVPVRKKPSNPFPDRLTIGRAANCDIVLRLVFISKVHAHLFMQPGGKMVLRDNNASNATYVNHHKLDTSGSRSVELGDILSFGNLDLELVDATRLHEILTSDVSRAPSATG